MILELKGLASHGKNRVKQWGNKWVPVADCKPSDNKIAIVPIDSIHNITNPAWRWISMTNDVDFAVTILE